MEEDTCLKISSSQSRKSNKCCKKLCLFGFSPTQRIEILKKLEGLNGYEEKSKFLASCMLNEVVRMRRAVTKCMKWREKTTQYYVNGVQVCRQAFTVLFGITHKRVSVMRQKIDSGCYQNMSGRSRHQKKQKALTDIGNIPESKSENLELSRIIKEEEVGLGEDCELAGSPEELFEVEGVKCEWGDGLNAMNEGSRKQKKKKRKRDREDFEENVVVEDAEIVRVKQEIVEDDSIVMNEGSEKHKKKKRKKDWEAVEENVVVEDAGSVSVKQEIMEDDSIVMSEGPKKHKKKKRKKDREAVEENVVEDAGIVRVEKEIVEDDSIAMNEGSKKHKKKKRKKDREAVEENAVEDAGIVEDDSIVMNEGAKKHKKKKRKKDREAVEDVVEVWDEGEGSKKKKKKQLDGFKCAPELTNDLLLSVKDVGKKKNKKKKRNDQETEETNLCKTEQHLESFTEENVNNEDFGEVRKKRKHRDDAMDEAGLNHILLTSEEVPADFRKKKKKKKRKEYEHAEDTEMKENSLLNEIWKNSCIGIEYASKSKKKKKKRKEEKLSN